MSLITLLKEVETDITSIGGISAEISTKVKTGLADLAAIRDEITTTVDTLLTSAKASLDNLKAVAAAAASGADPKPAAPVAAKPVV